MPRPRSVKFELKADTADANRKLDATSKKMGGLTGAQDKQNTSSKKSAQQNTRTKKSFTDLAQSSAIAGTSIGLLAHPFSLATAGLAGVGAAAVKAVIEFSKFETALAEVSTLIEGTPEQLGGITAAIQGVATGFGTDQVDAARAYYQIVSSGASAGAEANALLNASVKASVAGVTDIATAADGLTTALNAYGFTGEQAGLISDKLFQTVKAGKTTFGELASSIGKVAPLASQTGVSIDELTAGISEITLNGVSTSEAVTQLRGLIQTLIKPSGKAAAEAKRLGLEWNAAALQSKGLEGVLKDLAVKVGDDKTALSTLIPTIEGLQAALVLGKGGAEQYSGAIEAVANSAGSTEEAFLKMSNTLEFQGGRVTQTFSAITVSTGQAISEAIGLTGILRGVADSMTEFGYELGLLDAGTLTVAQRLEELAEATQKYQRQNDKSSQSAKDAQLEMENLKDSFTGTREELDEAIKLANEWENRLQEAEGSLYRYNEEGKAAIRTAKAHRDSASELVRTIHALIIENEELAETQRIAAEEERERTQAQKLLNEEQSEASQVLDALRRKYEPLNTAQEKYENGVNSLRKNQEFLKLSDEQLSEAIGYLKRDLDAANKSFETAQKRTSGMSAATRDLLEAADPTSKILREYRGALDKLKQELNDNRITQEQYNIAAKQLRESQLKKIDALNKTTDAVEELSPALRSLLDEMNPLETEASKLEQTIEDVKVAFDNNLITVEQYEAALAKLEEQLAGVTQEMGKTEEASASFGQKFGEGLNAAGNAAAEYLENNGADILTAALEGDRETLEASMANLGADAGKAFGSAFAGPFGAILGEVIGRKLGELATDLLNDLGESLFSSSDRVTVGVNATNSLFRQLAAGDTRTAASGLRLTPQARGAGDAGREAANELLRQFLHLDSRLVELLKELGILVDLTGKELQPDRPTTSLRPSEYHNPFGSVETDEINQGDLDNAANRFVLQWVNAIIDQVPPDLAEQLANATNMEEIFRILGAEVSLLITDLSDSSKSLYDQVYPLVGLQERHEQVLANLQAELDAGVLTQEEYNALVEQAGKNFADASREIDIANGVIFEVSDATQALLDEMYPLEALERRRTNTVARLDNELAAGVITQEQYNLLLKEVNDNYEEGAKQIGIANGSIVELSQSTRDLLDELNPLAKLERERTETLERLQRELEAGHITQEEYNDLVEHTHETYREGAKAIAEANGAIFELSNATQNLLDQLNPLAKLERERDETIAQLNKELEAGLLTQEEYNQLLELTNSTYADGALRLRESSDEFKSLVETIKEGIVAEQELRIEALKAEQTVLKETLAFLDQQLSKLGDASNSIGGFLEAFDVDQAGRDLSVLGNHLRTTSAQYENATSRVLELASATDLNVDTAVDLADAMERQRGLAIQLATAWHNLSEEIANSLGNLADDLERSLLSAEELTRQRSQDLVDLRSQIGDAETPEQLAQITRDINTLIRQLVNDYDVQRTLAAEDTDPSLVDDEGYTFSTSAFGQNFQAASEEALRRLVTQFAADFARAVQDESQNQIDDNVSDLVDSEADLQESLASLPEKLKDLNDELLEEQKLLVDRQEEIANQMEEATRIMNEAAETARLAAHEQLDAAEQGKANAQQMSESARTIANATQHQLKQFEYFARNVETMEDASRTMLTAAQTPRNISVNFAGKEVNA